MAVATTSSDSIQSYPVQFDTSPPDLCPQPLRLSQIKPRVDDKHATDSGATFPKTFFPGQSDATKVQKRFEPAIPAATIAVSRSRSQTSKLGSLVSRFEVLDAVNSADAESSHIPSLSKSKHGLKTITHQKPSPAQMSAPPLRAAQNLNSSTASFSTTNGTPDLSPTQVNPVAATARRSRLPTSTRIYRTVPAEGPPQTPSGRQSPLSLRAQTDKMNTHPLICAAAFSKAELTG